MKTNRLALAAAACATLAACGGKGGHTPPTSKPPAGVTAYPQVDPTVGSLDTFASQSVDDAGNTVDAGYQQRVTKAGSDGSYELTQDDPSNQTVTVDGITYHFDKLVRTYGPASKNYNLDNTVEAVPGSNTPTTCRTSVQDGGHPRPFYVGQTWTIDYTVTCDTTGTTTAYEEVGVIDAAEPVTVPAGTFAALRTHGTISWTTRNGENVVQQYQAWIDPAHSFFTLKNIATYQRTGTLPAHYVASQTVELQSRQ